MEQIEKTLARPDDDRRSCFEILPTPPSKIYGPSLRVLRQAN